MANRRRPNVGGRRSAAIRGRGARRRGAETARFANGKDGRGGVTPPLPLTTNADTPCTCPAGSAASVGPRPRCVATARWTRPTVTPKVLGAAMQRCGWGR